MLYFLFNSSTSFLGIIFSSRLRPTRTKVRKVKVRVLLVARVSPCCPPSGEVLGARSRCSLSILRCQVQVLGVPCPYCRCRCRCWCQVWCSLLLTTNYHCADITPLYAVHSEADSRMPIYFPTPTPAPAMEILIKNYCYRWPDFSQDLALFSRFEYFFGPSIEILAENHAKIQFNVT